MTNIELTYLPLSITDGFPCQKIFDIGGTMYVFEFRYNARKDYYTMYVYDNEYNLLFVTKIVYGNNLIEAVVDGLFTQAINAFDIGDLLNEALSASAVNSGNLNKNVRLYLPDD